MSEKVCIVSLGRYGDILSLLPVAFDLTRQGKAVDWYVQKDFASIFQSVPYVNPIIWGGPVDDPRSAYIDAIGSSPEECKYSVVLCAQVHNSPFPLKVKTSSYSTDAWKLCGIDPALFNVLPCYMAKPCHEANMWKNVYSGNPNLIVVSVRGHSTPHPQAEKLAIWLRKQFNAHILDDGLRSDNPADLRLLLKHAKCLIATDSMQLHLAAYTGTPTVAIVPDNPYDQSFPRRHWIEKVTYSESLTPAGKDKIREAVKLAIEGKAKPGMMLNRAESIDISGVVAGNPDEPGWGKLLSIVVLSIKARESFLRRLLANLKPQVEAEADAVELLVELDNGKATIGAKRNAGLAKVRGEWVVFVDDDDRVDESYVKLILKELQQFAPDTVGFHVGRFESRNGAMVEIGSQKISHEFKCDSTRQFGSWTEYERLPRHINPVKTWIAKKIGFVEVGDLANRGEDVDFAQRLAKSGLIKTGRFIEKRLYTYELRSPEEKEREGK